MRILLIILLFLIGCKEKKDSYNEKYLAMSDSADFYFDKTMCLLRSGYVDSAKIFNDRQRYFSRRSFDYYKLMYPNGNPDAKPVTDDDIRKMKAEDKNYCE